MKSESTNDEEPKGSFRIRQKDKVEKKVELIKSLNNSLTIWGTGLDIEKTIGVVEGLKRVYKKDGKSFKQETSIRADDNKQPHLQVIFTLLDDEDEDEADKHETINL